MIYGIGTDICQCSRLEKWIKDPRIIDRFFNPEEKLEGVESSQKLCEHYASRFAAKEAFVKALGTGFTNFELKDIFITKDSLGKPIMNIENKAKEYLDKIGKCNILVTLSHEKEYAITSVIIEKLD